MGKGAIARYEQFLLFPQCFQNACFPGASKGVIVWEWVNLLFISLRCIGSSQHLKSKYGSGYLLEIKVKQEEDQSILAQKMDRLKTFVIELFPGASIMEQFSERVQYKVPKSDVTSLAKVFSALEEGKSTLDIAEYSFSQSTLEQVCAL